MAEQTYTYNVSTDFIDGRVNPGKLGQEISASAIGTTLLRIDTAGGSTDGHIVTGGLAMVIFESELSSGDKTLLDGDSSSPAGGLLAAHSPTGSMVKVLRYAPMYHGYDLYEAPVDLDYTSGLNRRLHAKRTIVLGEVTNVQWYADYDDVTDTFSDLIIDVSVAYTRNAMGLPLYRDTVRTWYLEDGTAASPTKITKKYYRGNERTDELERRAKNAVAMQNTIGLGLIISDQMTNHSKTYPEAVAIGIGYASQWYNWFSANIEEFQRTNSRLFWDAIQALTAPDLQWAHDTPGFLAVVSAEVNFGGWT